MATKPKAQKPSPPPIDEELRKQFDEVFNMGDGPTSIPDIVDDPDWVRSTGKTPLEFLTAVYRHPLIRINDRIGAAKTVMEYTHRKMPSSVEMSGKNGEALRVSGAMLSGLSDEELVTLQDLLEKAGRVVALQP
jgi:hypothetical protein